MLERTSGSRVTLVALIAALVAATLGALFVLTGDRELSQPRTEPSRPRTEVVHAPAATPPPSPVVVVPAPAPAPLHDALPALEKRALSTLWPTAGSGDLVAVAPLGPFEGLADVCKASNKSGDDCKVREQEVEAGVFPSVGTVETFDASDNAAGLGNVTEYVGVKGASGWYVMPFAVLLAANRTGFYVTAQRAGDALIVQYRKTEGNRFDNDTEEGVVVCKPVDGAVACTPQLSLRKRTDIINTRPDDWQGQTSIALACVASYADGVVAVAAMPKPVSEGKLYDDDWTAAAAASCRSLAYAGKRRIAFAPRL